MAARPIPSEAVLIVNAHSRKGEDLFVEAREKLERAGVTLIAAHAIHDPARLNDAVRAAVRDGAPMVIVGGGDGSLSGTVDDIVDKDCVFAILPLGTANSFARTIGLPLDLEARSRRSSPAAVAGSISARSMAITSSTRPLSGCRR